MFAGSVEAAREACFGELRESTSLTGSFSVAILVPFSELDSAAREHSTSGA